MNLGDNVYPKDSIHAFESSISIGDWNFRSLKNLKLKNKKIKKKTLRVVLIL